MDAVAWAVIGVAVMFAAGWWLFASGDTSEASPFPTTRSRRPRSDAAVDEEEAPAKREPGRLMKLVVGTAAIAMLAVVCDLAGKTTMERLNDAVADGEDCATLFEIRNEIPPRRDAEVRAANEELRRVGCPSAGSNRTG